MKRRLVVVKRKHAVGEKLLERLPQESNLLDKIGAMNVEELTHDLWSLIVQFARSMRLVTIGRARQVCEIRLYHMEKTIRKPWLFSLYHPCFRDPNTYRLFFEWHDRHYLASIHHRCLFLFELFAQCLQDNDCRTGNVFLGRLDFPRSAGDITQALFSGHCSSIILVGNGPVTKFSLSDHSFSTVACKPPSMKFGTHLLLARGRFLASYQQEEGWITRVRFVDLHTGQERLEEPAEPKMYELWYLVVPTHASSTTFSMLAFGRYGKGMGAWEQPDQVVEFDLQAMFSGHGPGSNQGVEYKRILLIDKAFEARTVRLDGKYHDLMTASQSAKIVVVSYQLHRDPLENQQMRLEGEDLSQVLVYNPVHSIETLDESGLECLRPMPAFCAVPLIRGNRLHLGPQWGVFDDQTIWSQGEAYDESRCYVPEQFVWMLPVGRFSRTIRLQSTTTEHVLGSFLFL